MNNDPSLGTVPPTVSGNLRAIVQAYLDDDCKEIVQMAHRHGCPWGNRDCPENMRRGYLYIVHWTYNTDKEIYRWDESRCVIKIAGGGQLLIIPWHYQNECSWENNEQLRFVHNRDDVDGGDITWHGSTCFAAAHEGDLDILQWARAVAGCSWDVHTCEIAAHKGHLDILQWAHNNGCPWDASTCSAAASGGHLEILKWARANECPWNEMTCILSARGDHLEVLRWAHENGCPWSEHTCTAAASEGNLEILQWAHNNGCPWDTWTCAAAAEEGHLEILKWARAAGCQWDKYVCDAAINGGHCQILEWALENGCEWTQMDGGNYDNVEILQLAYMYGVTYPTTLTCDNEECRSFMEDYGDAWRSGDFERPYSWKMDRIKG